MNLINSHNLSQSWRTYLICLRSGFLILWEGRKIVIDHISPTSLDDFYKDMLDEARMNVQEGTLQDVARYWFHLTEHVTRSSVIILASLDKKSMLVTTVAVCMR